MSDKETTTGWALLELMGHRQMVGIVTRSSDQLVRIDVPAIDDKPAFTQEYGKAAIYCITWLGEEEAKAVIRRYRADPPISWMLPKPNQPTDEAGEWDEAL